MLGPYHPERHARAAPEHVAVVMAGDGTTVTYRQLADRSAQLAAALRQAGVEPGERIATLAENHPRVFEVCWAALRSGLYATPTVDFVDELPRLATGKLAKHKLKDRYRAGHATRLL